MLAVALALALAQPAPDDRPQAEVLLRLGQRLSGAIQLVHTEPDRAIEQLTAFLDDPQLAALEARHPFARMYREQAVQLRAQALLQKGDARAAADDLTALLDRKRSALAARAAGLAASPVTSALAFSPAAPPARLDWYAALLIRAQAWQRLGERDREQADHAAAQEILREMTLGQPQYQPPPLDLSWRAFLRDAGAWAASPLLVPALFLVMTPVYYLLGLRQRRDAGGSRRRLLAVAAALAAAHAAPVAAAFLLPWALPDDATPSAGLAAGVFVVNFIWLRSYVTPLTWLHTKAAPPPLTDDALLARIRELSARLGVAPPTMRVVRSLSAQLLNEALVSGLAAPTMLLFDGILYRLSEDERDAIIAHELAHIANHSFWYWLAAGAACSVAAVVAAAFVHPFVAGALGWALAVASMLALSRRLELDCDRRAAGAIGHRRAASALWKIHADQPFRGQPVLEFLIGAVSTHPSRDERLAAVRAAAPPDDTPDVEWEPNTLARRRLGAWLAGLLGVAAMAACVAWACRWPDSYLPALPLVAVALTPMGLLLLGTRKTARSRGRLQQKRRTWLGLLGWIPPVVMGLALAAEYFGLAERFVPRLASALILLAASLATLTLPFLLRNFGRTQALEQKVVIAIQSGDFAEALRLCDASPALVAGSSTLRHNRALLLALLGRSDEAIGDFLRLVEDDPGFEISKLMLATLYAEQDRYADARLAEAVTCALPAEPAGPQAEAWCLRKLGRADEAEVKARDLEAIEPDNMMVPLTRAALALDRGDHAAARDLLARAERLSPGTVGAALVAAELALASGDPGAAAAVEAAQTAARNNPLAFAGREAAALAARLTSPPHPSSYATPPASESSPPPSAPA